MNLLDLENQLRTANIRLDCYSLSGEPKNEALILEPSTGNGWRIYYCERGLRTAERVFPTEGEACVEFLEMIMRDPLTRQQIDNTQP